jgi:HlyD family secretion protein
VFAYPRTGLLLFAVLVGECLGADPAVARRDFVKTLTLGGELQATERLAVVAPRVSSTHVMVVSHLATEGSVVAPGDLLVQFDVSDVETRRLELEQRLADTRVKIAQTEAQLDAQFQDLLLAAAQARRNLGVSRLYVDIDPQLIPAADLEKYRFEHSKAEVELEKSAERLATLAKTREAEMEVVRLEYEQADLELKRILGELDRLTIRAPGPGLVVHGDNPVRSGKIQVGDSVWPGWAVLYLPDMNSVKVEAFVYDTDVPYLRGGEAAEIILDAAPERVFAGRLATVSETAMPRQFRSPLKAFRADVVLDEIDPQCMKPGMTARVRIRVARPDALVVPRRAIFLEDGGRAFVRPEGGSTAVPVEILDANREEVVIEGDVLPGTSLRVNGNAPAGDNPLSQAVQWLTIDRDSFRFFVTAGGTIEAERSVAIGPPAIPDTWRFRIVDLAPEGSEVGTGDRLVALDPSESQRALREERANLEKVLEELEKTRASAELQVKDLEIQLEEARVQDEKARNKLVQAREFESNLRVREAEFDAELARERVDLLERKLASVGEAGALQRRTLEDKKGLHEHRIQRHLRALEELVVRAPAPGVVIYETNWRNEKKQIGSEVFRFEKILSLPDMDSLVVRGHVAEVDAGRTSPGQEVDVTLDAVPDRTFRGRITDVGTVFRRATPDRPTKILDITVRLENPDPLLLRPGMVARLEIVTARFGDVLAVPLAAVAVEGERARVWVETPSGPASREVVLGEDNGIVAVVTRGLTAGERIAARPLGSP